MTAPDSPDPYSIEWDNLTQYLRGESYLDVADRIDAAGNDLPTVLAALEFGLETCSGEAAEILERMYRALTIAAETGGHGIDVAITDGPLADRIGRAGDFTGQSVKGILVVAFGTIDSTRDMDEQFDRGVVRLRELLEVSEAAMPGGSGLSNKIREAFDAGLNEAEIARATKRYSEMDVARLIRRPR